MEQLDAANNPLHKIFERAVALRQEITGQRYFPVVVQYIAEEIGGGYALTGQERAAIQAGILAAQAGTYSAAFAIPIPQEQATAALPLVEALPGRQASRASRFFRLQRVLRRTHVLHEA